jgi:hypothetical protein
VNNPVAVRTVIAAISRRFIVSNPLAEASFRQHDLPQCHSLKVVNCAPLPDRRGRYPDEICDLRVGPATAVVQHYRLALVRGQLEERGLQILTQLDHLCCCKWP